MTMPLTSAMLYVHNTNQAQKCMHTCVQIIFILSLSLTFTRYKICLPTRDESSWLWWMAYAYLPVSYLYIFILERNPQAVIG